MKHKAWNTYKATQRYADFILYTRSRNIATASIRKAKSTFESNLAISIKNNPSIFWKYVRNNAKVHSNVIALTKDDDSITCSDYETANSLNKFFSSVFTITNEPPINIPSLGDRSKGCYLDNISITHNDVLNELNRLKTNKCCGPDNCHPCVLKKVKDGLVLPLYLLFNKS